MSDQLDSESDSTESGKLGKSEKKRLKKLEEEFETAVLTPWERYRALMDQLKQNTDIIELADRKTRFALVIGAALNTMNFLLVARPDLLLGPSSITGGGWLVLYIGLYAGLSLFLCVQAIWALKPRMSATFDGNAARGKSLPDSWLNLLSWDVIAQHSAEGYYELWHHAQFAQVNREVALSVHTTSRIIIAKFTALKRLYGGLLVLVFLTASLVVGFTYLRFGR